jgi:hypothetical protein
MEETVPILHSYLMRRNTNLSRNPNGVELWYLRVTRQNVVRMASNDSARIGA